MPLVAVDRISLPSLRTYTAVSVVLLSISVYYAMHVSSDPALKVNVTKSESDLENSFESSGRNGPLLSSNKSQNETFVRQVKQAARFMVQEPFSVWSLVNMAYCCLLLLGAFIQKIVFGELRVSEQQHMKDKFWNFIFYKFIFVFGIINVQYLHEVVFWCAWFSILGFLNLLTQLGKDRFEYLSFSPSTSNWSHVRLLGLLIAVFGLSGFMLLICIAVGFFAGFNTFAFMAAECVQLNIRTLHIILKYVIYLYDLREGDSNAVLNWEKRGPIAYYAELIFELTVLLLDFIHHIHMLLWSNIFLSIASLVICMQLRHLFHEIQRRIKKHRNYLWVMNHVEQNYPMATAEELLDHKDNCAICWEEMDNARKLPCGHLFHNSCLQSWLEQDTSCPTCRTALSVQSRNLIDAVTRLEHSLDHNVENLPGNRRMPNHFFHFDGSRYVSWLPSFSLEVTHLQLSPHQLPAMPNFQIDVMVRQVQQLFDHIPASVIADDLRISRSVELTIENILDGRVVVPVVPERRDPDIQTLSDGENGRTGNGLPVESFAAPTGISKCQDGSTANGGTFSNSSVEREKILHKRKEQMILDARKKYLSRSKNLDINLETGNS